MININTFKFYAITLATTLLTPSAFALDCPKLSLDNQNEIKSHLEGDTNWKVGFHQGFGSDYIVPYLATEGAKMGGPEIMGGADKQYCEYQFSYPGHLKTYGPYKFVLHEEGVKPPLEPSWGETIVTCIKEGTVMICQTLKAAQEQRQAYIVKLKELKGLLDNVPKGFQISQHGDLIQKMEDLINMEEEANLGNFVGKALDEGAKEATKSEYQQRKALVQEILKFLREGAKDKENYKKILNAAIATFTG